MLCFTIQGVSTGLALFCGLSRIKDNRHHPTDVLTGFAIGILVAIWIVSIIPIFVSFISFYLCSCLFCLVYGRFEEGGITLFIDIILLLA